LNPRSAKDVIDIEFIKRFHDEEGFSSESVEIRRRKLNGKTEVIVKQREKAIYKVGKKLQAIIVTARMSDTVLIAQVELK